MKTLVTAVLVLLLAAPSILQAGWVELDPVGGPDEEAEVLDGGCCARVRGHVFVTVGGYGDEFYAFDLQAEQWLEPEEDVPYMPGPINSFGAMCGEGPSGARIFVASDENDGELFVYTFLSGAGVAGKWLDPEDTPIYLPEPPGGGVALAFHPREGSISLIAGFLYYLPGESKRLWRRAFEKVDYAPDGLYPTEGGQMADGGIIDLKAVRGASDYELQVSTSPDFSTRAYTATSTRGEFRLPRGRLPLSRPLWYRARYSRSSRAGDWSRPRQFELTANSTGATGVFPPAGAVLATARPVLDWVDRPEAVRYRVQMSRAPDLSRTLVDEAVPTGEYVCAEAVSPGTYYWRSSWQADDSTWSGWSSTSSFALSYDWVECDPKPSGYNFLDGAAMVYARSGTPARESLYVMVGNGSYEFWAYSLNGAQPRWQQLEPTPFQQNGGASLAPHLSQTRLRATEGSNPYGVMWQYVTADDEWDEIADSELPRECADGSGVTYGDGAPLTLVISDEFEETNFYKWGSDDGDGLQTASVAPAARPSLSARLARGGVRVTLVVPTASRVTLSVIDAAGRRAYGCDVGVLGAGRHELTLDGLAGAGQLAPGAYFIRAQANSVAVATKAVVF